MGSLLAAQNDYQLPEASADFIGDWCGWERLTACQPAGSCDAEQGPESLSFSGGAGQPVSLHYEIASSSDMTASDISVESRGAHDVRVTLVEKYKDPEIGAFILRDVTEDIVSKNPATLEDTESVTDEADSSKTMARTAELHKCTEQFLDSQQQYLTQHNEVGRGAVEGNVPN
ncbi:MAG: hypothetical protein ABSG46_07350 [Candidatus Binataceae bacterium]